MTFYRNIFLDTLVSINNGVISVEDLGTSNRVRFLPTPNAIKYTLYGRVAGGDRTWTEISSTQSGADTDLLDNFSWIDSEDDVNIEYKVEVETSVADVEQGYITEFEGRDEEIDPIPDPTDTPRPFIPDHRPVFAMSLSVDSQGDPDITVNGLTEECEECREENPADCPPRPAIETQGASALDHWKMNKGPLDGSEDNFLYPPCPDRPSLSYGYSINRKSNPNTTDPNEDFMLRLVYHDPTGENHGPLEDAYQKGYRRFMLRGVFGMRTSSADNQGSAVPSAIWSAGDPNLGTWHDKPRVCQCRDPLEYPFTSNGNLMSMDPTASKGDAQQSVINFLKPWIQSKEAAGDPVDVYIYGGVQATFYADGEPARGSLSGSWFQDGAWAGNNINPDTGVSWRDHYPLADYSKESHVRYFNGEYFPWMDIGVKGFMIDGASNINNPAPAGDSENPTPRPPGFFEYFRNYLGVDVLGEAVPLSSYSQTDAAVNEDLIYDTGYMAYSNQTFWGERWRNINLDPSRTEVHNFLIWAFDGGNPYDPPGDGSYSDDGFNTRYASKDENGVTVYDIDGMKNEIDQMRSQGFVVSTNIGAYSGASPPNEASAREAINQYIADTAPPGPEPRSPGKPQLVQDIRTIRRG